MSKSAVYSVRLPLTVIAQAFDTLESLDINVTRMPVSTCIRTIVEAVCAQLTAQGKLPSYSDETALVRIGEVTGESSSSKNSSLVGDLASFVRVPTPDEEPCEKPTTSSPPPQQDTHDPEVRDAMRQRVHDMLGPQIEAAREADDARRFHFVGENQGKEPREAAPITVSTVPPWENAEHASADVFSAATKKSKFCAVVEEQKNQLGAVAARMVIPNLSTDMLGTEVAERMFLKTYEFLVSYMESFPDTPVPVTFLEEEEIEVGVTEPPEINEEQ